MKGSGTRAQFKDGGQITVSFYFSLYRACWYNEKMAASINVYTVVLSNEFACIQDTTCGVTRGLKIIYDVIISIIQIDYTSHDASDNTRKTSILLNINQTGAYEASQETF